MSPRRFDSILLYIEIGSSRSLRRLTISERWTFVAGILMLAAKSPVRGALLIAPGEPVSLDDIAEQAGVPKATAKTALDKLTSLDVLTWDDEIGGLIVVNWNQYQPQPKASDSREAWRERKQRERERQAMSRVTVTRDIERDVTRDADRDVTPNGHADSFARALAKRSEGKRRG